MAGPWVGALLALPFALVLFTTYVKFAVVLAILRRGIGGGALPGIVTAALALLFALFVAAPVCEKSWAALVPAVEKGEPRALVRASGAALEPVRLFLERHAPSRERALFFELQRQLRPGDAAVSDRELVVLAAAFVTAELRRGFEVGFLLLLPFLVIDLLVSLTLAALGIEALQPQAIALPLKLLLFVLVDGWQLLFRGLILGYT